MIGVDSNILLRWIVDDGQDRPQTAMAADIMNSASVHVSIVSLLELLWGLRSHYHVSAHDRLSLIDRLLVTSNLVVQHADVVAIAAADTRRYGGDLPDHLLAGLNEAAGCDYTLTFDKKAGRSPKLKRLIAKDS